MFPCAHIHLLIDVALGVFSTMDSTLYLARLLFPNKYKKKIIYVPQLSKNRVKVLISSLFL